MDFTDIKHTFFNFFQKKGHQIVEAVPLPLWDDSSLLFVNAGMNPFKKYFLDIAKPTSQRVANAQKCLRVSGKHNDLEVG